MIRAALRNSVLVRRVSARLRGRDPEREQWFEDHYPEWRAKRIDVIVDHYGEEWFRGASLLEVGCGFGEIGAAFARLGAAVTCSDARQSHLDEAARRHPGLTTVRADLDRPWALGGGFDVVLHLGVLYHLADPARALTDALGAGRHVVLESEVADSSDPHFVRPVVEVGYDQAFNHRGCRPSPAFVERILTEAGRPFVALTDDRCNWSYHRYDWPVRDTGRTDNGLRRLWFVGPAGAAPLAGAD